MVVATIYSDTSDGMIGSFSGTYSTARSGAGLAAYNALNYFIVGQDFSGGLYFVNESFLSFDTSSLGASATVSAVVLDAYLTTDESTTDFTINARTFDWSSGGLTTADWVAGASISGNTLLATRATSGIGSTGAYKAFTSQAAFLTAPNLKTGTVYMLLSSSRHEGNNTPGGLEQMIFSSADESGTTQDPKLATAFPLHQRSANRIWRV